MSSELGFLEIGGDPHIVQRNHGDQLLPGLNVHSHFDVLGYYAVHRRRNFGVLQIQLRLLERGLFLLHRCLGTKSMARVRTLICCGAVPAARRLACASQQMALRLMHLLPAAALALLSRLHSRGRGFRGHQPPARTAAAKFLVCRRAACNGPHRSAPYCRWLALARVALGRPADWLLRARIPACGVFDTAPAESQLARGIGGGDRDILVCAASRWRWRRRIRLAPDPRRPGNLWDRSPPARRPASTAWLSSTFTFVTYPADARADQIDVAVDLGIVRGFPLGGEFHHKHHHANNDQDHQNRQHRNALCELASSSAGSRGGGAEAATARFSASIRFSVGVSVGPSFFGIAFSSQIIQHAGFHDAFGTRERNSRQGVIRTNSRCRIRWRKRRNLAPARLRCCRLRRL